MPNHHKVSFQELYKKKKGQYCFFEEKMIFVDGEGFTYLTCQIDEEILQSVFDIAREKSDFTMSLNQACIYRNKQEKIIKCMQGVLAETFIHLLLIDRYKLSVKRYDLERDTFKYSTSEYDLKILSYDREYTVESRSSNIYSKSIKTFVDNDAIIGPYFNKVKLYEDFSDFHFRPVYQPKFNPFEHDHTFNDNLLNGNIKLIITGVATKEEFQKHSYIGTLGQNNTQYRLIKAKLVGDIKDMDAKFANIMAPSKYYIK